MEKAIAIYLNIIFIAFIENYMCFTQLDQLILRSKVTFSPTLADGIAVNKLSPSSGHKRYYSRAYTLEYIQL